MSGLDTSQTITDEASQHADELHLQSRPHKDISGESPLDDGEPAASEDGTAADSATPSD